MTTQIKLSPEQLETILRVADESCAYWARTNKSFTRALNETVSVNLKESNGKLCCLLPVMLESAATKMFELWQRYEVSDADMKPILRNTKSVTSEAANIFVQIALFGEVRY